MTTSVCSTLRTLSTAICRRAPARNTRPCVARWPPRRSSVPRPQPAGERQAAPHSATSSPRRDGRAGGGGGARCGGVRPCGVGRCVGEDQQAALQGGAVAGERGEPAACVGAGLVTVHDAGDLPDGGGEHAGVRVAEGGVCRVRPEGELPVRQRDVRRGGE
eukprot:gene15821-biopygen23228